MNRQCFAAWSIGFLLSCLFIWAVSAVFCDGIAPVEWDSTLGQFVRAEGSIVRFRSEGWSDTRIGRHGLTVAGEAVLDSSQRKFILWGDSFADAVQMDDTKRASNRFNEMHGPLKAFTVAGGGLGVSDYYYGIPRYEKLDENIVGHVILLVGLDDTFPGGQAGCHSRFLSNPWRFEASSCEPSSFALRYASFASHWRLEFLYTVYRFMRDHCLRFAPGQVGAGESGKGRPLPDALDQAWTFLVQSLREQSSGFIVFVYVPLVPRLEDGRINMVNSEDALKERFGRICEEQGAGFVDLSHDFRRLYEEDKRLPSGFFNAPPGGHLNEDGQGVIAEGLQAYFARERP